MRISRFYVINTVNCGRFCATPTKPVNASKATQLFTFQQDQFQYYMVQTKKQLSLPILCLLHSIFDLSV